MQVLGAKIGEYSLFFGDFALFTGGHFTDYLLKHSSRGAEVCVSGVGYGIIEGKIVGYGINFGHAAVDYLPAIACFASHKGI